MRIAVVSETTTRAASYDSKRYLSPSEYEVYTSLTRKSQIDWLAGRIALKQIYLSQRPTATYTEVTVKNNEAGVPYIEQEKIRCSIAHSFGWGAAAISDDYTGIDIERIRPHNSNLLSYAATEEEVRIVEAENICTTTAIWTIKEAVGKALGLGLSISLKAIKINSKFKNTYNVLVTARMGKQLRSWQVTLYKVSEYYVAVARRSQNAQSTLNRTELDSIPIPITEINC